MQRSKLRQFLLVSDGYFTISFHQIFPVLITALLLLFTGKSYGQSNTSSQSAAYVKVITERADKIVAQLNIGNAEKAVKVRDIIRDQYSNLNDIYALRDSNLKAIKIQYKDDQALRDTAVAAESRKVAVSLAKLHPEYIRKMSRLLNDGQIEQVKNGMTYNVLPITYKAYQEQILTLNEAQKKQILIWLTEAREHAIDAESSDKKHAWFGKYKGRINNYLSAAGYDLRKEGEEWQKRIKAQASQAN